MFRIKLNKPKNSKSIKCKGYVDNINNNNIIYGWAFSEENSQPVNVELYINDKYNQTVIANKMRPSIKKSGLHKTGLCGYEFDITKISLHKIKKIDIKINGTDKILPMNQNIIFGTKIELSGLNYKISIHKSLIKENTFFIKLNLKNGETKEIKLEYFSNENSEDIYLMLPLSCLKTYTIKKIALTNGENIIDLTKMFERFILKYDINHNNNLLINDFIQKKTDFTNDELFVLCYNYIDLLEIINPFYGAFLTVYGYRIADQFNQREILVDELIAYLKNYVKVANCYNPEVYRWVISCGNTFTVLLLAQNKVEEAKHFIDFIFSLNSHQSLSPITHQNNALLLFNKGLINMYNGNMNQAQAEFVSCIYACYYGVNDIFTPRNNLLHAQYYDVRNLIDISQGSHQCLTKVSVEPLNDEFEVRLNTHTRLGCSLSKIFHRFNFMKNPKLPLFYKTCQDIINKKE